MPNEALLETGALVSLLRELSGGFLGQTTVVTSAKWVLEAGVTPGGACFRSEGEAIAVPFESERQLAFFEWLAGATWLDRWPLREFPEEELLTALNTVGAVNLSPVRFGAHGLPGYTVSPRLQAIAPDGRVVSDMSVLVAARHPRAVEAGELDPDYWVNATELWRTLAELRQSLQLATLRARGDEGWRQLLRRAPIFEPLRVACADNRRPKLMAIRDPELEMLEFWFLRQVWDDGLEVAPIPEYPRMVLGFRPRSPKQRIWVTLATTAGILESPFEVDGLFQCDYGRCARWFFSSNLAPKGEKRFCSVRCGKSFHAAAATRRRRAAEKERASDNG